MPFNVGDRVECVDGVDYNAAIEGQHGVVRLILSDGSWPPIGVEFDQDVGGHDLYRPVGCRDGHGWFCDEDNLRLIERGSDELDNSLAWYGMAEAFHVVIDAKKAPPSAPAKARTLGEFFRRIETRR